MKVVSCIDVAATRQGLHPAAYGGIARGRGLPGLPPGERHFILGALFAALAGATALPAAAIDAACHFTTECFENEPCDEADFVLRIRPGPEEMSVRLGGPADEVTGELGVAQSGATLVLARGPSSVQILTIGPDESARYTLHLTDGPAMVSYIGTCEDE
ncbi:hypothetical protein ACVDG3_09215 [Meridianimarinicoccus sp. RP-17]|uniref:hypothetical protein n=1 Tax=Meridianimarinicoccus zhengii TaxID=2056810 RepID=UPI000DAB5EE8|nr:hypothetical protein [Phycocomes zhengii]